jgi:starch-binding outer membrane protein, SusD/RagB family
MELRLVRRVNLMLDNIDKSDLTQAEKDHWRSVGYFFRAYYYAELIARFGDVPWIDKVVTEADEDIIYGTRMPRTEVAQKVMDDLKFAETKIKTPETVRIP